MSFSLLFYSKISVYVCLQIKLELFTFIQRLDLIKNITYSSEALSIYPMCLLCIHKSFYGGTLKILIFYHTFLVI